MKRSCVLLLTLTLSLLGLLQPISASAEPAQNTIFPINLGVYVPCAVGGAGEIVLLTGNLHDLFQVTSDGSGGFHVKSLDNPQEVSGTGLTSGDKYQGTGVTQYEDNFKVGQQYTYINNFRIIGQGPGNNYLVHDNFHVTINANGEVTVFHDNFSIECK